MRIGIFATAQKAAQNYTEAQNQELSQLADFTDGLTAGKISRTENGVQYVGDGAGNLIPVPVGFSYLEGTKNTGFVIKNNTDDNEFVWVPVGEVGNYQRIAWQRDGWTYTQTLDEATGRISIADLQAETQYWTETMPTDEQSSVSDYGGFYIGRYEAGIKNGLLTSESNSSITDETQKQNWTGYTGGSLVVQDNQQQWNYITRDKAKTVAEGLYSKATNNVNSKLCSSYAWDSALKFIGTKNATYPTDSIGGNYNVATGGTGALQKTGYHAENNIYDMGGNTWEWTTETWNDTGYPCVHRGAGYNDSRTDFPAAYRGITAVTVANRNISFRVTMFI